MLKSKEAYIKEAKGSSLLDFSMIPKHVVVIGEETYRNISNFDFKITCATEALVFNEKAILELYNGNTKHAQALQVYLLSRDHSNLTSEFQHGNGKINVSCVENLPAVDVILGVHLFLTVRDYSTRNQAL